MIKIHSKFPTRTQFLQFQKVAKQSTTTHLRILTSSHAPSRLSIIVPKKVNKLATTRNYLKRQAYDLIWQRISDKNLDCVVIFKPIALLKNKQSSDLIIHEISQVFSSH